jgi:hypothetical protein
LRAEPVMQPLVNQICVVKTESRAPNEPLLNRSYGSTESRFFFRRTQKDAQFKLGRRRGRILFVLLFASVLGIMAQWTEEDSLQLTDIYKTSVILWDPKSINHYKNINNMNNKNLSVCIRDGRAKICFLFGNFGSYQ